MLFVRSEHLVTPARIAEYEAFEHESLRAAEHQPGFLRQLVLAALDNPALRIVYQVWESRPARVSFARSAAWVSPPEGMLAGPSEVGFYDVHAGLQEGHAQLDDSVIERRFRIRNGRQAEFEAAEKELCGRVRGQPGFVARRILKFSGNDTAYVRLSMWRTREAMLAWVGSPCYIQEQEPILTMALWSLARQCVVVKADP
jgi:heme-degrading monooxygenase HmoA